VPIVLYSKKTWDFTPDVVTALNRSKGTVEATTEPPVSVGRPVATPKKPK
jgi:hypothetical protein